MTRTTDGEPAPGRAGYAETVRQLAAAQKSGRGAPAYSRYVNRRLGRYLAAAAHQVGATPDAVTAVSGLTTFVGIAVLALGSPSWGLGVAVCLLLVLGYALDAADGQLARLRGGGSTAGEWLDHMVDSAKISSLHLAVLLFLHRSGEVADHWLLVPMGFAVVAAVSFFAQILNEQLLRGSGQQRASAAGPASAVVSLLKVPTDYGLLCLVFLLLGAPVVFLGVYGLMLAASTAYLALALVRWHGQMRRLDAERASALVGG
ncbi:CDP-alcohol phosphatidyltransferase family protein [uncultured Pseudokineococcus sp.]|uniref:CDP-alcohol phosphatidyltransferase family protein n=1 Tax=uncultured Pseudokineococcus sp. TaxID=1642928 RepID=UPI0026323CA6|nr:CDP-alcohol phosphatidyltransferase family protein [uncultured Pseudokineococcus sp.]